MKNFKKINRLITLLITILVAITLIGASPAFLSLTSIQPTIHSVAATTDAADTTNTAGYTNTDVADEYEITKSVLLKTSVGTYGEAGYFSTEFYSSLTYSDRWLTTADKSIYNYGVAKFAVMLSSEIYPGVICMVDTPNFTSNKTAILDAFGFEDTQLLSIENEPLGKDSATDSIDDEDVTTVVIGHKLVTIDGQQHDIYVVVIRGTMGASEWESNFDVGNSSEEYIAKTGEHPEWTDLDNHKGFDVVTNRTYDLLKEYISTYHTTGSEMEILVTGHSRGAGIANILGTKLEADGYDSCAYTFASPNTTTAPDKYPAKNIFNIINSNDFITTLPLDEWGFKRYGTDICIDIANESDINKLTGDLLAMDYVGMDPSFLTNAFSGFAQSRDELYTDEIYECAYDTLEEKNYALANAKQAVAYLSLDNFITITDSSAPNSDGKYYYTETLCVGSFMTGLSRLMSDNADFMTMFTSITHIRNVYPKDSKYAAAIDNFLNSLTAHMLESFYPHMTTCYYAIVEGLHNREIESESESTISTSTSSDSTSSESASTNPVDASSAEKSENKGIIPTILIILAAVLAAGVVVFFIVKKKKGAQ